MNTNPIYVFKLKDVSYVIELTVPGIPSAVEPAVLSYETAPHPTEFNADILT